MNGTGAQRSHLGRDLAAASIVLTSVLFNAVLAIVNAHVVTLSSSAIVAAEAVLVGAAHAVALSSFKPRMAPWYGLAAIFLFIALSRALATGDIEVKYLRDVLLIPTFIVLGMTFDERRLTRFVVVLHAIVLAVLVFEALDTPAYAALFDIKSFYIQTRGYTEEQFWVADSTLFPSAVRPDERFFALGSLHRLSSLFLEPVSLGNYCVIATAFVTARFARLGLSTRLFLIGGILVLLVGSDGRLALATSIAIVLSAALAPRLPRRSAVIYLPAAVATAFAVTYVGGFIDGPDTLTGRVAHTVALLQRYDLAEFLGASDRYLSLAVDSGLAYLVTTQSLLGVIVLWLFIVYAPAEDTREQVRFTHAAGLYLAAGMMVSFSMLSIKTAAILWFVQGVLQSGRQQPWSLPSARPRAVPRFETRHARSRWPPDGQQPEGSHA